MGDTCSIDEERELLEGFIADSKEMIDEVEPHVIALQQCSESGGAIDCEILNTIFRLFHSLKGAAGFLNLKNVTGVTHEAETLLNLLREGKIVFDAGHTDLFFRACDFIRLLLAGIEEKGNDNGFESEGEEVVGLLRKAYADPPRLTQAAPPQPEFNPQASTISPNSSADQQSFESQDSHPDVGLELSLTPEMEQQFIQESDELFETIEQSLLDLEKSEDTTELLANAFRGIHSFKGNCGFLGYADLERLSHKTETVLDYMKNGKIPAEDNNIGVLLKIVDILRNGIAALSRGESAGIQGCEIMVELLGDMIPDAEEPEPQRIGEILVSKGEATPEAVEAALALQNKPLGKLLVDMGKTTHDAVESALAQQAKQEPKKIIRRDIRVDIDKLDMLNDLVGELVTAQAMVVHNPDLEGYEFENFEKSAHHLQRITSELQDLSMAVRMVPIAALFRKMIRLVHDLSRKSGKKVKLELIGEETEVDKTVIELISDPLVHIIRNAVDHGIEPVDKRLALGKKETGDLMIEAKHEGGEVWITIQDDGYGLNREKILAKALSNGLIRETEEPLSDAAVFKLIFEPGFSTAEKVTDVSGRGVGMDVVKKNIDKIKGRIDIQSVEGRGTTIILRIPLTLAIIDGMLVRIGQSRYIIPLLPIRGSFKPQAGDITVMPDGQAMVRVREALLPVVRLHELYHGKSGGESIMDGILVTLENRGESICLLVDEILGQRETVIKGLSDYIGTVKGVSGCTILRDGEVSLILDAGSLLEKVKES